MRYLALAALLALSGCSVGAKNAASSNATSTGSVRLNWAAASGNVAGYYIEQATAGGGYAQVQSVTAPAVSATITGLAKGATYQFRVRAFNAGGNSSYTTAVSVAL